MVIISFGLQNFKNARSYLVVGPSPNSINNNMYIYIIVVGSTYAWCSARFPHASLDSFVSSRASETSVPSQHYILSSSSSSSSDLNASPFSSIYVYIYIYIKPCMLVYIKYIMC